MSTAVIYNTVTGFSRTYAEWIAEELGAELLPWQEAKSKNLAGYDVVIYGAGVRMSAVRGFNDFRRKLKNDGLYGTGRVIVFATGGTPVHPERNWRSPAATLTKEELARGTFPFFYFEGGIAYEGLNWREKTLLKIFSKRVQKHRHRGEWAEAVANGIIEGYDHTDREAITPLVEEARRILASERVSS
jgi:hypothetical protein